MKKYMLEIAINDGEWKDEMMIECNDFDYVDATKVKVNGAMIQIPSICNIVSYSEID